MFFEHVLRENRPVSDFLNADYTFLNERLAAHYGIEGVTGSEFRRVTLTTDRRGGVLSQGARADRVELSDAHIAGDSRQVRPAEPPRHAAAAAARRRAAARGVRRRRVEVDARAARSAPRATRRCASCHRNMDPLGFGLENYDAIGRWRDTDGEFPVDASGTLPDGQRFTTAGEMRALLLLAIAPVLAYVDREDADLRAAARPSSHTIGGRSRAFIAPSPPTGIVSEPWFIRLSKACRFKHGEAKMSPEGYADVHHTPCASTKNVPARDGHGGRAAVPRCDDSRAGQGAAPAKHPCAWRSSTCRTEWTCGTGT